MMSWRVLSSVICPNTGIVYSHIVGLKLLRLIIWYESDIYLLPGDRIHTTKNGIFVNGVFNKYLFITSRHTMRTCGTK